LPFQFSFCCRAYRRCNRSRRVAAGVDDCGLPRPVSTGALDIWGGNNFDIQPPSALTQSLVSGGTYLPLYRLSMIGPVGPWCIRFVLWLAMEKDANGCRGARYRGRRADGARRGQSTTNKISMLIFALGAGMAALGGVIGGAFLGVIPASTSESYRSLFCGPSSSAYGDARRRGSRRVLVGLADNSERPCSPSWPTSYSMRQWC